jgi:hypothetical protein
MVWGGGIVGNEGGEFDRQMFQIAYHGDTPDDHSLNVEALAPALLGFGRLIRESNEILNGEKAQISVLVTSDFEHKCFHISFEVVQIYETIKSFLQDEHVQTAKQLLQIIGVIRSTGATSLLDYLKWKQDKPVEKGPAIQPIANPSLITINVVGNDNTIAITPEVLRLAENKKVLDAVKETLAPIEMNEASRIEFRENDHSIRSIDKAEARGIVHGLDVTDPVAAEIIASQVPDMVLATLYVYSPVFDAKAKRWRFVYKRNKHIYADISETSIAKDAIKRGGSFTNDRYRVRMEVTEPDTEDGDPHFKITQVLDFTPAPQQTNLPLPKTRAKRAPPKKPPKKKR